MKEGGMTAPSGLQRIEQIYVLLAQHRQISWGATKGRRPYFASEEPWDLLLDFNHQHIPSGWLLSKSLLWRCRHSCTVSWLSIKQSRKLLAALCLARSPWSNWAKMAGIVTSVWATSGMNWVCLTYTSSGYKVTKPSFRASSAASFISRSKVLGFAPSKTINQERCFSPLQWAFYKSNAYKWIFIVRYM